VIPSNLAVAPSPTDCPFATVRGIIYPSGEYWLDGFSWCRARSRSHLNCQELGRPAHQGPLRQEAPTDYLGRTTEPAAGLRRGEGSRLLQCWYTRNCRQQVIESRRRGTIQMQPRERSRRTFEGETETCCAPSSSRHVHLHLVRSRYDVALVPVERKTARIGSTFGHESLTGC
jgi:hypothetical protein